MRVKYFDHMIELRHGASDLQRLFAAAVYPLSGAAMLVYSLMSSSDLSSGSVLLSLGYAGLAISYGLSFLRESAYIVIFDIEEKHIKLYQQPYPPMTIRFADVGSITAEQTIDPLTGLRWAQTSYIQLKHEKIPLFLDNSADIERIAKRTGIELLRSEQWVKEPPEQAS